MNNIYIYDGSFSNLLNLISYLLENKIKPFNIKITTYNPSLFEQIINIKLKENFINEDIFQNHHLLKTIYYVYLSDNENKEITIYYFLLNYFKFGNKVFYLKNLKCVDKTLKIAHLVSHEAHRFKGFTRFKELKNKVLYATIAPDNNILPIISKHFQKRLKNELWLIKDENRNIISLYDKKKYYIVCCDEFKLLDTTLSENEMNLEILWKTFFKTVAIKERENKRCQMNFMPKKYWQNIIEMSD